MGTRRRKGDRVSWEYLENWPILEKETLRGTIPLLSLTIVNTKMFHEHTVAHRQAAGLMVESPNCKVVRIF